MFKKIILAALVVASAVYAQINVGGRAAVNFGTLWGEKNEIDWGLGFNAGVNAKIGINEKLSFIPGLEIDLRRVSGEGYDYDSYTPIKVDITMAMWYLDVPLALRYSVNPQFFVDAGLYLGVLLSGEETDEAMGMSVSHDMGDYMESIDLGLLVGVGYNVMPNLDVNFRFALGLTETFDGGKGTKNMRLQLGATYWFM